MMTTTSQILESYKVLGLNPGSDRIEIKKAFRIQSVKYHPDKNIGKDTTKTFQRINSAHEILCSAKDYQLQSSKEEKPEAAYSYQGSYTRESSGFTDYTSHKKQSWEEPDFTDFEDFSEPEPGPEDYSSTETPEPWIHPNFAKAVGVLIVMILMYAVLPGLGNRTKKEVKTSVEPIFEKVITLNKTVMKPKQPKKTMLKPAATPQRVKIVQTKDPVVDKMEVTPEPLIENLWPDMVEVPAGCNYLGSNSGDPDEKPAHRVCFEPFRIDKYEVTQRKYRNTMDSLPKRLQKCLDCPVSRITWQQAQDFCRANGKRLPTEKEWEYAARAGSGTDYYWGEKSVMKYAWYDVNSKSKLYSVGLKKPNAWGLYDMSGNVWEWTSDRYRFSAYDLTDGVVGGDDRHGNRYAVRGGASNSWQEALRPSERWFFEQTESHAYIGFRCAGDV